MDCTFQPITRPRSLNFIDRFRNKISRVDKHAGIIGALHAHPNLNTRYQTEQSQNDPTESRAVSYKYQPRDHFKKTILAPLTAISKENFRVQNSSRQMQLKKKLIEQSKIIKKVIKCDDKTQTKTTIVLPPLILNDYGHQKTLHKVKQMRKQKQKSHWVIQSRNSQLGQPQNHVASKIR